MKNLPGSARGGSPAETGTSLTASVAIQVRAAILQGTYAPGAKLRSGRPCAREYGVSLSPLREALDPPGGRRPGADHRPARLSRGARARRKTCAEVTKLRTQLEVMALTESLAQGDDRWEDSLVAAVSPPEPPGARGYARRRLGKAHRRLPPDAVRAPCGMPLLLRFCGTPHDLSDRYRRLFLVRHAPDANVPGEHQAIFDAAMARDAQRAAEILTHSPPGAHRGAM